VSTAVATAAHIELSFEDIRGLLGNKRKILAVSFEDFPSKPPSPPADLYKIS
jgi:hypothetical protein